MLTDKKKSWLAIGGGDGRWLRCPTREGSVVMIANSDDVGRGGQLKLRDDHNNNNEKKGYRHRLERSRRTKSAQVRAGNEQAALFFLFFGWARWHLR